MLHGGANIPYVNAVEVSDYAAVWQFMNNNAGTGGTNGGSVETKHTTELCLCGKSWVGERSLE